ncbi:MAG: cytidine deaminase [Bacteroidales bacterium]|nr:cytidine deaminase [Bacteroidales bacterium]
MRRVEEPIIWWEADHTEELDPGDRELLRVAKEASKTAYSPYSAFSVGAAVKLDNGEVITGTNQENVAYPSGLCAERVALFYASSRYPDARVQTIAIAARARDFSLAGPITPCGACRQVIAESEARSGHPIRLIMAAEDDKVVVVEGIRNILPLEFRVNQLKK